MIWLSCALLILGLYLTRILYRHLHEAKLLRLRELVHAERMAALERDLPLPESSTSEVEIALSGNTNSHLIRIGSEYAVFGWVRFVSLAIGLIGLFGGIGTMAGFYLVADDDVQAIWPLGLIAVFFGLGMLLFVRLTRGTIEQSQRLEETK